MPESFMKDKFLLRSTGYRSVASPQRSLRHDSMTNSIDRESNRFFPHIQRLEVLDDTEQRFSITEIYDEFAW